MPRLRRLVRWSANGIAAMLVLLVIGLAVVQTSWFKNWLRLKLVAQAGTFLDADLRVGHLGGSLWTGVTLDDVVLSDRHGAVLKADHIRVRYDPFTLARRRWVLSHVAVEHAAIDVVQSPAGWNILHLARPHAPGGTPLRIAIQQLELSDSTITIAPSAGEARTLAAVDLDGALTVSGGSAALTIDVLRAHDKTTGLTLREFSGRASDNFRAFEARFVADGPTMRLAGSVHGDTSESARRLTTVVDLTRVDLARLTGRSRLSTDITGRVEAVAVFPGAGAEARVTFKFAGPTTTAFGYTVNRIDATGQFAKGVVTFDARLGAYDARATVDGSMRFAPDASFAGFTGRGTFAGVDVKKLPRTLKLPPIGTQLDGRFDATVDARGWRAHTTLSRGAVEGATLANGTEALIDATRGVTAYAAAGHVSHVDLVRLGRTLPVRTLTAARFAGDLSGTFVVGGQNTAEAPPVVFGRAVLDESTLSGTHVQTLDASVYLSARRLSLTASGVFDGLNETTLGIGSTAVAAAGRLNGWLTIADLDRPIAEDNVEAAGRLELGPSSIRGISIDAAIVDGQLVNGVATVRTLDLQSADATLHAEGVLGVHESKGAAGVTVTAAVQDRTFINRVLQWPVMAAGSLDATITGTMDSPSATGALALYETSYRDAASALTMTAQFNMDWPQRHVDALRGRIESQIAFATIGGTEIQQISATAVGGVRDMAVDVRAEQPARSLGVEGRLTLEPGARKLVLRHLALTTQDVEWGLPAGQSAVIGYGRDRIDVNDLALVRGNQRILISGGFDLEPPVAPGDDASRGLQLQLHDVELADVNRVLLGTRQLSGQITGTATIAGTRQAPIVDADVVVRGGTVENVPYSSLQARGRYADHQAALDVVLDQAPGASLRAVGTVPIGAIDPDTSMDVRVSGGPVNLGLVQALTTEIDNVRGEAALDLHVTGSLRSPQVNGTATLANGALDLKATGVHYQAIEAAIEFTGRHLAVHQFQLADANGDLLKASGGLDVIGDAAGRAIDVRVQGENVSVLNNRFGTADMDADLRISGTIGALVVRGAATLESGRLEVAQILERTTATPYSTEPQAAPSAAPAAQAPAASPLDRADIALQVRLPDNLVLRGRDLRVSNGGFGIGDMNIVTGGSFDVTRHPGGDVNVVGALDVVRGSYSFQGRRFDIERGSDVRFRPGAPTDPFLNVNATRDVSGITAAVHLRGTASAPELTLSSRPPLDEGDILSLIVFNQPINSLGSAERLNLGERAAAIAAGAIASPLADSLAQALNLDVFEIQAPTSTRGAGAVTVGSQIGSRLFVGLQQQFGHDEGSLLTLEYRINEMLRFVTSIARGTLQAHATRRMDRGGVDLIFLIRY